MILVSGEYMRVAGLGNKLFPWARAKIFSTQNDCKMLRPLWFSPHGGAVIRGGIDYRFALSKIWLLRNFIYDEETLGWYDYWIRWRKLPLYFVDDLHEAEKVLVNNQHIVFRWDRCHNFADLQGYQEFLRKCLSAIIQKPQLRLVQQYSGRDFIALNVRTGNDFLSLTSGRTGYYKTDKAWFICALDEARRRYGNLPAIVVSDGGHKQLKELLREPDVSLLQAPTAVADLLVLSKARVFLGSGNSTFSAWASFLGEMDTFSSSATPFDHFKLNGGRNGTQIVGTLP